MSAHTNTHTPAPWHWESDPVKGDPFDRVRYQVTALGKTVTRVYYSSYEGGPTNAEADARLISAAPELLAVLQSFVEEQDRHHGLVSVETYVNAVAIVKKATGEHP